MSSTDKTSVDIYKEFGVPYDLKIFKNLPEQAWFNVIHLHGDNIMFDVVKDYPVQAISWHVWETEPSTADFIAKAPGKCIVGGLKRFDITNDQRDALREEVKTMRQEAQNRRLILAPGCVIRYPFNKATLDYLVALLQNK
jgi:uroporphyrinogen decarboxylase